MRRAGNLKRIAHSRTELPQAGPAPSRASAHPLVRLQQTAGNAAVQTKLRVGAPGDRWEREADRIASDVSGASARPARASAEAPPPAPASQVVPRSGGSPIAASVRGELEDKLGYDLSAVRIHADRQASALATGMAARAYTIGRDIVFNEGEYRPHDAEGRRLLAHEVVHVVQQQGGQPAPAVQRDDWLTRARQFGERAYERGERVYERGERLYHRAERIAERVSEEAGERYDQASEEAERWWNSGTGDIQRITFDGATVELHGTTTYSAPALSGLLPNHPSAAGVDYTDPVHQNVADKGPIPEGSYYLEPSESESNPPVRFNTTAWGRHRTRLHETLATSIRRRATTERTGGFYLHQDANNNGTAGCIGIISAADNREIHRLIRANTQRIPVEVDYAARTPAAAETTPESAAVRRTPMPVTAVRGGLIQRDDGEEAPALHYLVQAGLDQLHADNGRYGGAFPNHYYDELSRALFEVALRRTGSYSQAFSAMDSLCDGDYGFEFQREYTALVGTDSENGWDKMRHFNYTAYLQYVSGGFLAPELFTYGKEIWDALEGLVGLDPEGYSIPDIRADNRGELFAEQMRARELRERARRRRRSRGPAVAPPGLITPLGPGGGFGGLMDRDRRRAFGY